MVAWLARQPPGASGAKLFQGRVRVQIPEAKPHDFVSCVKPPDREVAEKRRRSQPNIRRKMQSRSAALGDRTPGWCMRRSRSPMPLSLPVYLSGAEYTEATQLVRAKENTLRPSPTAASI